MEVHKVVNKMEVKLVSRLERFKVEFKEMYDHVRMVSQAAEQMFSNRGCTYGLAVPMDWLYLWTGYTYGLAVPMDCVYLWTGCTYGLAW